MRNIMMKEIKLSASCLSFIFIAFGLMFLLPGYPILCGVFFVTLGIFKSFENTKVTNDILFSALLPIAKREVVKGKFYFVCLIELWSFIIMGIATVLRMTLMQNSLVYRSNVMMNANLFALGMALFLFGVFNIVFVSGFFKTAYNSGRPFLAYIILCFIIIGVAETLHHLPNLEYLNAFGTDYLFMQFGLLLVGVAFFLLLTYISYRNSCKNFEGINL